jgi:spore coat protein H
VHLYVKDETSDPPSQVFLDYGLFTQVEQPNRTYLRNHLLDPDGQLYKPNFFEFYRYPENIRLLDDPLYDEEAFVRIIEPKNTLDHSKLINMLEEVNDWSTPIEITFEKNFDADNYFTWLAFNILTGNVDTQSQNYYLYSPKNSEKWYFIPWDYDQAFTRTEREDGFRRVYDPFEEGVSNYWGGVLHNRVLRNDFYRNALDEKINELLLYMTPERIEGMLNEYRTVTDPFVLSMPDIFLLGVTPDEYEHIVTTLIPSEVQRNYELYLDSLDKPMPFYLGTPQKVDDILQFNWDPAYDFDGQDISYEFIVSKDLEFKEIVYDTDLADTVISIEMLEPGTYFWRVIATNEDGFSQLPFDTHFNAENDIAPGMKYLYISPDGQILETALEEIIVE